MRRFEIIQLGVVALAVFFPVFTGYRLKRGRMAVLLVAAMTAQLVLEGWRWQLVPLQLATLGLAVGDLGWEDRRVRGFPRFRRAALGLVGVGLVAALPALMPVPQLPPPSGPFGVGTSTFVLVDSDRQDPYGRQERVEAEGNGAGVSDDDVVTDPRRIVVQAWYPAVVPDGSEPAVWNPDWEVVGPAMARSLGFPGFFLDHLAGVRSHSHPDIPPMSGRFPVVIYSHGWGGFRTIALNQLESLASHGYLVLAADHTHGAVATRFPDGQVVPQYPEALPEEEEEGYDEAAELLVKTYAGDLILVLDELAAGEEGGFGPLADHADLSLVGIYGHSTGGGAAVRTCLLDDRCAAVAGLDAWVVPVPDPVIAEGLSIPSLFIRSDGWQDTPNDRRLRGLAERSPEEAWWTAVEGAGHNDFVLAPVFLPVADRLGLRGEIDPGRVVTIIDQYLTGFFDRYLYWVGGAVLTEPPPPEVELDLLP